MRTVFLIVVTCFSADQWHSEALSQEPAKKGAALHANVVVLSNDGKVLCAAYAEGFVCVWDVTSGNLLRTFRSSLTCSMKLSKDGKYLAIARLSESARVLDLKTGKEIAVFRYDKSCDALSFSDDGKFLAIAANTNDDTVRVWSVESGKIVRTFKKANRLIHLTHDGNSIFLVEQGEHVLLRETKSGKEVAKINTGESRLTAITASNDGKMLITGHNDKSIRIWEVATGKETGVLRGHTDYVTSISISADAKWLMSYGKFEEQTARVWDLVKKAEVRALKVVGEIECDFAAIDGTGKVLATVGLDDTARIVETSTGKVIRVFHGSRPAEE